MPKLARYIKEQMKATTVAIIYTNNDFGKGGRDEMQKALAAAGIKVVADVSTDPGQVDFAGVVLQIKQSNPDVLFAYLTEEEGARLLRELKKQGFAKPIVGETTIIGQKVIELAGDAAEGVLGHVGLTADAPQPAVKAFDQKYLTEYKQRSDHNGMKGYSAVYIIKAVTEKVGKFDSKALAAALHGARISAKENPGALLDVSFDQNGDLDRESFIIKVVGGKQQVIATVPASGRSSVELQTLSGPEGRATILDLPAHGANPEPDGDGILHFDRAAQQRQRHDAEVGLVERECAGNEPLVRRRVDLQRNAHRSCRSVQRD